MQKKVEATKLVRYVGSLSLKIPTRKPPNRHVGAIISDAVMQVGHNYENQVRKPIVSLRRRYPRAATVSGFLHLLGTVGAQQLLGGWKGQREHRRLSDHAKFFAGQGINTFDELAVWLQAESNRDSLIRARLGIKDKTADYYRVLVGLPDAVKVDSRVEEFLADAGIDVTKYAYTDLRAIVQLAARQLGETPINLEGAIWDYKGNKGERRMGSKYLPLREAKNFAVSNGFGNEAVYIDGFPKSHPLTYKNKNRYRRGLYMELFRIRRVWQQFMNKHWPNASTQDGRDRIAKYDKRAKEILEKYPEVKDLLRGKLGEGPSASPEQPVLITISLLPDQQTQLEELAHDWKVQAPDLARIWILEHLHQLH